jgi:AcrR family transcriptional regulator
MRAPSNPPRRVPTQARSRERARRILDAAAEIFAETGYETATTEAIAARAGTSIGSVYQFFPNKQALFDAVAQRYLERTRAVFDELTQPAQLDRPWEDLLDGAIDAFAHFDRHDKDFRAVMTNWHLSGDFFAAGQALNREFARRTEQVLATKAARMPRARRALVAEVVVEVISAMLFLAVRSKDDAHAKHLIKETKTMLHRYLRGYVK